jgi:oligosaccharyltransferase complex subunit gamma
VVYVYPATEGSHAVTNMKSPFIKYDFSKSVRQNPARPVILTFVYSGFDAAPLAASLSRHTPVPIPYKAPINWNKILTVAGSILPFLLAIRYLGPALMNRWTWAFTTIVTSLVMTSGFMFVRIRGSPHSAADGSWIAGGYSNQYGQEVNVVASICECLMCSVHVVLYIVF